MGSRQGERKRGSAKLEGGSGHYHQPETDRPGPPFPLPNALERGTASHNTDMECVKEEPVNLTTWDALLYLWRKLLAGFAVWNNRQELKRVSASPQVLGTYHDSFLYGDAPLSVEAKSVFRTGWIGSLWNLVELVLSLLSGVLYVYSTYGEYSGTYIYLLGFVVRRYQPLVHDNWADQIQNIISFIFVVDYVLRIYCEPVRLYFIFSFWGAVDVLSAFPVILIFRNNLSGKHFLKLLQYLRLVRVFNLINKVGMFGSSVLQQIALLTVVSTGVVLLDAGVLHWVEYHLATPTKRASCTIQGCLTFWEALYFLVVTIATVGYGDITPKTVMGQLVAMVTIVAALTILPIQIGRITSLAYRRPYGGSFSSSKIVGSRFLIISGSITLAAIQNFLAEFYNPTHCEDLDVYPLRVIILAPFSPSFELKQTLHLYNGLVEFIEGSPVRQSDLERVSADKAAAFFLLADRESGNAQVEDASQIVQALAVHRFCHQAHRYQRKLRIVVEVLDPETHSSAVWDESLTGGIEVICPVKVHYKMMARSCAVHGLYTLITNLFTSEVQLKYMNRKHFLTEYSHSFDNEVYPVILPEAFHGLRFGDVVDFIFVHFTSVLFAVDTVVGYNMNGQPNREVLLFPKDRLVSSDDIGIIISSDLHTAYAISTYRHVACAGGLLTHLQAPSPEVRRYNQGTEIRDPKTGKWRRTSSTVSKAFRAPNSGESQSLHSALCLRDSETNRIFEFQTRMAMQDVYSGLQQPLTLGRTEPDWAEIKTSRLREVESPQEKVKGTYAPAAESLNRFLLPEMCLETAAADLLAWPPVPYTDRPHPAAIEKNEDVILKDLKEKTIIIVAFDVPHILVCCQTGWPSHFFYFLLEICKPGLLYPPVVMLHPRDIGAKEWGSVGVFKDVFFLKGSPLYELDLLRGGVLQAGTKCMTDCRIWFMRNLSCIIAEKIVVLADLGTPVDLRGEHQKRYLKRSPAAYTSDVDNMVVAANVQRLFGHSPLDNLVVEMQESEAFFYLRPQYEISRSHFPKDECRRKRNALVHFGPSFMEGKAVSKSMLGFLMRSSFYNRNTQALINQLIQGGHTKAPASLHPEQQKVLDQVLLPEQYANRSYSELFLGLLCERGVLTIGLYRVRGTLGAPTAYVLTNPLLECIVNPDDLLYVLY